MVQSWSNIPCKGYFPLKTTNGPRNNSATGQWSDLNAGDYGYNSIAPTISNVTEKRSALANLVGVVKAIIAPINDTMKITKREGMSKNMHAFNNKKGENRITLQMDRDSIKTTLREVIQSDYNSNLSGPKEMYVYDPDDVARKTKKEDTVVEYTGNMKNSTTKPPSYESINNAEINELREYLEINNRKPTPSNVTLTNGKTAVHLTQKGKCLDNSSRFNGQKATIATFSDNVLPIQTQMKDQYDNTNRMESTLIHSLSIIPYM